MLDAAAPVQPPKWTKENPPVVVTVNRHRAAKERPDRRAKMSSSSMAQLVLYLPLISPISPPYLPGRRAKMRNSIMAQLVQQLAHLDRLKLVRRDRAFKVKFAGEAADDYGGPYREVFTPCYTYAVAYPCTMLALPQP